MPNASNARNRSVSARSANRRGLGQPWPSEIESEAKSISYQADRLHPNDPRILTDYDDDKRHGIPDRNRSRRLGSLWLVIPLFLLVVTHNERQILFNNYLPATVYGLYACGAILLCISVGNIWLNAPRGRERNSCLARFAEIVDTRTILAFAKAHRYGIALLISAASIRIVLQIVFLRVEQCLTLSINGLVPLAYIAWKSLDKSPKGHAGLRKSTNSAFVGIGGEPNFRCDVQIAILMELSSWTVSYMMANPRSTVICEASLGFWITILQMLSVVLNVCILISAQSCLGGLTNFEVGQLSGAALLSGTICLVCAPVVLVFSLLFRLASGIEAFEIVDARYFSAFSWEFLIFILALALAIPLLSSKRIITLLMAFYGIFVVSNIPPSLNNREHLSLVDYAQASLALASLFAAYKLNSPTQSIPKGRSYSPASRSDYMFYVVMGLTVSTVLLSSFASIGILSQEHPIDALMYSADHEHESWATQAKQSQTLEEAVINYRKRYNRQPPPSFHIWYNFAIARNSDVIDDFDNIEHDLAPFRAMRPPELRERIKETVNDRFNEVGLIKIRDGKAIVDKTFEGHSWMMDVMVLMMEYFILSLPDMDIPFNINDEPRVVVPHDKMKEILSRDFHSFSMEAAKNWSSNTGQLLDEPFQAPKEPSFENWSFRNNFKKYSTLACPPDSMAKHTASWLPSRFCIWCSKPHSTMDFVKDSDLANDPCHQPDLANLHGFYQGPGAYKITKKILPVFSASKPQGYADILYPSIWEWDDGQRVRYAPNNDFPSPDYVNKSTTLFWRGSSSEGLARRGKWRTFSRQRFVYMNSKEDQSFPVYVPVTRGSETYKIESLTKRQFLQHASIKASQLSLDTGFTSFEKAWEDLEPEVKVLGVLENEDFQSNWQHKYLMSLDEGSASRSFIPFVMSNSLPFRATIFREWFDDRLTAWKHYVPIDLRFRGLWSTLAYFAGGFGSIRTTEGMDAGEYIAESGRLWGNRVLRKDDMEIYLFRLLLEWGRLLDDQRDELGFQL